MKAIFFIFMVFSGFILSSCGQYGGLYLPAQKNPQTVKPPMMKANKSTSS